jgi:hypothetical protein
MPPPNLNPRINPRSRIIELDTERSALERSLTILHWQLPKSA